MAVGQNYSNASYALYINGTSYLADNAVIASNKHIQREGISKSWYQGRDSAIIKTTTYSGYDAILSMKTTAGDWALGVYSDNKLYFTYILDSNYSANNNTITKQFIFDTTGNLTATKFTGALVGDVTGNCSGSSGSCTGNAAGLSGGLTTNDVTTHGNLKVTSTKGSYYGINFGGNAGGLSIISQNASGQGLYNQTNGQWIFYYNAASNSKSIAIGSATINVTGGISLNKSTVISGTLVVTLAKGNENHVIARASGYTDSKTLDVKLMVGSGKINHGVYSTGYSADGAAFTSSGKWLIYRNSTGTVVLPACATDGGWTFNRTTTGAFMTFQQNSTACGSINIPTLGPANTEGWCTLYLGNSTASTAANNASGRLVLYNKASNGWTAVKAQYGTLAGSTRSYMLCETWFSASGVTNAVWNDYAECRNVDTDDRGYCVTETPSGQMVKTTKRLQAGCKITSDTFGSCMGQTDEAKTPIAVSGRVLVYPYRHRANYKLGAAVCSAPGGTVDIMTREEIMMYPERIVGTVSEIPTYEVWHGGLQDGNDDVKVNGRIWIYVR